MTEAELYKELGALTKDKGRWKESISYVSSLLTHDSVKIQAKALWLLGEMGLMYPQSVQDAVPAIAAFLNSPEPLLRERVLNVLGKRRPEFVRPYLERLRQISESDENRVVRIHCLGAIKATGAE